MDGHSLTDSLRGFKVRDDAERRGSLCRAVSPRLEAHPGRAASRLVDGIKCPVSAPDMDHVRLWEAGASRSERPTAREIGASIVNNDSPFLENVIVADTEEMVERNSRFAAPRVRRGPSAVASSHLFQGQLAVIAVTSFGSLIVKIFVIKELRLANGAPPAGRAFRNRRQSPSIAVKVCRCAAVITFASLSRGASVVSSMNRALPR